MTAYLNADPVRFRMMYEWLRGHDRTLPEIATPEQLALVPTTSVLSFRSEARTWFPESDIRYLVTEFDPAHAERVCLVPQRIDTIWRSLDDALVRLQPMVAVLIVPVFWQLGPMFFRTCRARGVPVSVLSPRNLPLATQLIAEVQADVVVSTPDVAADLAKHLDAAGLRTQIRSWHLIAPLDLPVVPQALSGTVLLERHLIPGLPIISTTDGERYVMHPEYLGELADGQLLVTSLEQHARPLVRLRAPAEFRISDGHLMYGLS